MEWRQESCLLLFLCTFLPTLQNIYACLGRLLCGESYCFVLETSLGFFRIFFGILSNHKISEAKISLVKRGAQNFLFGLRKSALQYSIFSPNRLGINLQICSSFALHQNIFLSRMSQTLPICPWCDHGRSHVICLMKICQRKTQNIPLNI